MEKSQSKSNPVIAEGKTPENMEAPLNKSNNGNEVFHTHQSNRETTRKISRGTEEPTPYSNPNIENYLGSEKMSEKLSTQTEKHQNDMRMSDRDKNENNKLTEKPDIDESDIQKAKVTPEKGIGGSETKDGNKPEIRYSIDDTY